MALKQWEVQQHINSLHPCHPIMHRRSKLLLQWGKACCRKVPSHNWRLNESKEHNCSYLLPKVPCKNCLLEGSQQDNLSFSTTWTRLLMAAACHSLQTALCNYSLIESIYYSSRTGIHHDPTMNRCQKRNSLTPRSQYKLNNTFFNISKSSILDIPILHFTKTVSFTTFPFNLQVYVDTFSKVQEWPICEWDQNKSNICYVFRPQHMINYR